MSWPLIEILSGEMDEQERGAEVSKNVLARARIQVMVEIGNNGPYGNGWTIDQIHEDAKRASLNTLAEILRTKGGQIIGEPKVVVIMTQEE